ncbi:MAG: CopD family protein [Bradyrhizobium sp.]|uniref:CopD family protein n=1 Tax=Bradyrhizobium sp. TaxID=376 RepID=UPI001DEC723B|nr:CopD family protein [Bradyrhizobium sp.]MBV9561474.1 CopD family protein [Bradyrhizobium sp.]
MLYALTKAGHIVSMVLWLGGMLAAALALLRDDRETLRLFKRWDQGVTTPAMFSTWVLGAALAVQGGWFGAGWLSVKLAIVVVISAVHGIISGRLRSSADAGRKAAPDRAAGITLPVMIAGLALIVLLVVLKPSWS